jgi:anti-anti-sigma regulatory factor
MYRVMGTPTAGSWSSGPPFGVARIGSDDDGAVLVLVGEVDIAAVSAFETAQGTAPISVVAIDAGDVTLLSATAVNLMLRAVNVAAAEGRTVALRRSNPHVERVLSVLGVDAAFARS